MVVHACDACMARTGAQNQLLLHSESVTSLGYMRRCLKNTKSAKGAMAPHRMARTTRGTINEMPPQID